MTPLTIGLPFYNNCLTLPATLRSILAQTTQDWRLIMVDDGSTDGSADLVAALRDRRITLRRDGEHRGLVSRLNELARCCETEYLCRMDADDLMHPDRLRLQLEHLRAHPEVDVLGTEAISIDEDGLPRGLLARRRPEDFEPAAVLRRCPFIHPTIMGRAEWFRANPYSDAFPRAEDRELWCRVAGRSRLATLARPLLFYREPRSVNLGNYVRSGQGDRAIFRAYGPRLVGAMGTRSLILRSHLKRMCYQIAASVHLEGHLVGSRAEPLREDELADARRVLAALRDDTVQRPSALAS